MSRVSILLNKDRYIEFHLYAPPAVIRQFRFLVPISKLISTPQNPGSFAGPKSSLPLVKKALGIRGFEVKVTEDWI